MPVEVYTTDAAGHLMLVEDLTPDASAAGSGEGAPAPPADTTPAPAALPETPPDRGPGQAPARGPGQAPDRGPGQATPPDRGPGQAPAPADDLAALRRMVDDQREQAARSQAQLETVTKLLRGEPETAPPQEVATPRKPSAEQFATHEDYIEAVAEFKADERLTAFRAEQHAEYEARAKAQWQQQRDTAVKAAEDAFVAQHPDYHQQINAGLAGKAAPQIMQTLMLFDEAPAIAYALAQDAAMLARLNQMPPPQMLYALGQLSARVGGATVGASGDAPAAGGTPPATRALGGAVRPKPAPPRPLSGTGVGAPGGFHEDMTMEQYRAWRNQHGA